MNPATPGAAGPVLDIVLVEPEQPRNVGAVVRAAANMQISTVHVVRTAPFTPDEEREIRVAASGAWEHVALVQHDALPAVLADADVVLGTSARQREQGMDVREGMGAFLVEGAAAGRRRIAVLLGRESQGLTRAELRLCHGLIHIPTNPDFASLNLAQAALIIMLDYRRFMADEQAELPAGEKAAGVGLQERWLEKFGDQQPPQVVAQLRRLLHRAQPTDSDMAMLFNLTDKPREK